MQYFSVHRAQGKFVKNDVLLSGSQIMINTAVLPVKLAVPARQLPVFITSPKNLIIADNFIVSRNEF